MCWMSLLPKSYHFPEACLPYKSKIINTFVTQISLKRVIDATVITGHQHEPMKFSLKINCGYSVFLIY